MRTRHLLGFGKGFLWLLVAGLVVPRLARAEWLKGEHTIDWSARFTAGKASVMLDRTPMRGEPGGKVNGGYAGLGLRLAGPPSAMSVVCSMGAVTRFESDRTRPCAAALAVNSSNGAGDAGAIAFLSEPANAGAQAPWYLVNSRDMRFACAAILAPRPRPLAPDARLDLRYRIVVRREPWTPAALREIPAITNSFFLETPPDLPQIVRP